MRRPKLRLIGTGVYAVSGAIATMAGALYAGAVAEAADGMLSLFVLGLLLAIVGGMRSVPLALAARPALRRPAHRAGRWGVRRHQRRLAADHRVRRDCSR